MSQVIWTAAAEDAWQTAWELAPQSRDVWLDSIGPGPTRAAMTAEREWLSGLSLKRGEFQTLGEDRGHSCRRIWVSDLHLVYEFLVDLRNGTVYVQQFRDGNDRQL